MFFRVVLSGFVLKTFREKHLLQRINFILNKNTIAKKRLTDTYSLLLQASIVIEGFGRLRASVHGF